MSISEFDAQVCKALVDCVQDIPDATVGATATVGGAIDGLSTYGEELYLAFRKNLDITAGDPSLRETLREINLVEAISKKPNTKSTEKVSAKDQIIIRNIASKITEKAKTITTVIIHNYSKGVGDVGEFVFNNKIVDIRAVGFLYLCWFNASRRSNSAFGVIVSTQRFLKAIQARKFISVVNSSNMVKISAQLVVDLQLALDKLMKAVNFRGDVLYKVEPALILEAPWDKYAPRQQVQAFPHQKFLSDLILNIGKLPMPELVKTAKEIGLQMDETRIIDAFFVPVCVLTNSGKTTAIVNVVTAMRRILPQFPSLRVIAVCAIENIRRRWANLLAHCDIPYFSYDEYIDTCYNQRRNPVKSEITTLIKKNVVSIFPPEFALEWLHQYKNVILFYDEPTMYADTRVSGPDPTRVSEVGGNYAKLMNGVAVLKCMPRFTFLCSATLDSTRDEIYEAHKLAFPSSQCFKVYSKRIYGYTNVMTNEGVVVAPHMNCKTRAELKRVLACIDKTPLLGKFYNPTVVMDLYESAMDAKVRGVEFPNVMQIFGDIDRLSPDDVKETALQLLEKIATLTDDVISEICSETEYEGAVDYKLIGTKHANRYQHMNLVATADPSKFLNDNFESIYTEIKTAITSYKKLLGPYETWLLNRGKIANSDMEDRKRAEALDAYDSETTKPPNYIPSRFQINTMEHYQRFTKGATSKRGRIPITTIYDLDVCEKLDFITHAGAGLFGSGTKQYDDVLMGSKTNKEGLVTSGRLEFLVANNEIAYGTDVGFGGLFVDETLLEEGMSINSIFQLISRIGRGRKSAHANVYLHSRVADVITKFIKGEIQDEEQNTIIELLGTIPPVEEFILKNKLKDIVSNGPREKKLDVGSDPLQKYGRK